MVVPVGVEPTLYGLKVRCINRSARAPCLKIGGVGGTRTHDVYISG